MLRLDFITLFPGMFTGPFTESIMARAQRAGVVDVRLVDLRDAAVDKRRTVDDTPYGGGAGMVLKPEPLADTVRRLRTPTAQVILMTPQGRPFSQRIARELASRQHLILVCSHYEGVDERVRQLAVDDELSIGDYVLTNGNLAAMVVADAVIRLLPGALGSEESTEQESFSEEGLLEYPHYTRPEEFQGAAVPEILRSGNHRAILEWRWEQRLVRTIARRPDLLITAVEERQHGPESSENPQ